MLGNVRLDRITAAHAEDVITSMRKKKHDRKWYSNSYINTVLAVLRRIVTHAFRRRVIAQQPFSRERLPPLPESTVQNELTTDERDHLLASFTNEVAFRDHFVSARSGKRQVFKRNSEYITYYFDRFRWSEPLFSPHSSPAYGSPTCAREVEQRRP